MKAIYFKNNFIESSSRSMKKLYDQEGLKESSSPLKAIIGALPLPLLSYSMPSPSDPPMLLLFSSSALFPASGFQVLR
jgi:hypothetical protein